MAKVRGNGAIRVKRKFRKGVVTIAGGEISRLIDAARYDLWAYLLAIYVERRPINIR